MADPTWVTDPIGYLIGPHGSDDFFENYYEKKALRANRDDPARYHDLLSIKRIDEIVASVDLPAGSLDMARTEPPIHRDDYTFNSGFVDRGAVVRHFQQGATIIMPHLHQQDAILGDFCRALESVFCAHLQTNIYLTPPDNQGFKIHYDDHDVFVIQISGEKAWRFYETPIENPFRGEGFRTGVHEVGEPTEEFLLKAGDCIYVPRGLMHDAQTSGDEPSLHITIGLIVKTWADLMLEAVSEVALRTPEFRHSLPPGFARDDYDKSQAEAYFKNLATTFAKEANFEEAFELFVENFIRSRSPNTIGGVVSSTMVVSEADRFIRRRNTPARLRSNDDQALIIAPGGEVPFEVGAVKGLEAALTGEVFGLAAFSDLAPERGSDVIKKLIAFGLVEKVNG